MALPAPSYSLTEAIAPATAKIEFIGGGETVARTGANRTVVRVRWLNRQSAEARRILDELIASSGVDVIEGWETPPRKYRTDGSFSSVRTQGDFFSVTASLVAVEDL